MWRTNNIVLFAMFQNQNLKIYKNFEIFEFTKKSNDKSKNNASNDEIKKMKKNTNTSSQFEILHENIIYSMYMKKCFLICYIKC